MFNFENKFTENRDKMKERIENLKTSFSQALKLGLLIPSIFILSQDVDAQNSNSTLIDAIEFNENYLKTMNEKYGKEKSSVVEKDGKPAFVFAGESEMINFFQDKKNQDSIYNETKGIDDFAAGVTGTLILNKSDSESFHWFPNNPTDVNQALKFYHHENDSGAFDSETVMQPSFGKADYYIVFSTSPETSSEGEKQGNYQAKIFSVEEGLIDVLKMKDTPEEKFSSEMGTFSEIIGNRIESLK